MRTRWVLISCLFLWLPLRGSYVLAETITEFLPLNDGNSWTYNASGTYGIYNKTFTVLPGITLINNVATKAIQVTGGPNNQDIEYWSNDTEGMRVHGSYTPVTEIGSGSVILEPPMVAANSNMDIGETVNTSGKAVITFPYYGTFVCDYESTFTLAGRETVTVPEGTYETVKVSGSYRIYGYVLGQPFNYVNNITRWLAKYIGVIKDTYTDTYGSEAHLLISTNVKPPPVKTPARFLPFLPILLDEDD